MKNEKIGKFIKELRDKQKISQTELAEELFISREAVSKWERGINIPSAEMMLSLSKFFNITISELLNGEFKTEENKDIIDSTPAHLYNSNKKKTKIIHRLLIIIGILALFLLGYYFFSTFNTLKVYDISFITEDIKIPNGTLVLTKEKAKFNLGKVNSDKKIEYLQLFYKDKNDKEQFICNTNDDEIAFTAFNGSTEYFDFSDINHVINNLYLKIDFKDTSKIIKLNVISNFSNSYFFPKKVNGNSIKDNSTLDYDKELENKIFEKFANPSNGVYTYSFKEGNFTYFNDAYNLILNIEENNISYTWIYCLSSRTISYQESQDENILNSFDYIDNEIKCNSKTCKNEEEKIHFFKECLDKIFS